MGRKRVRAAVLTAAVVLIGLNPVTIAPGRADEAGPVILVSVDGLASSALGATATPNWARLVAEGATTLNARTIVEFTQTFPNHTSLFTGRPATGPNGHGVDFNVDDGSTIHSHAGTYISSIFDVAHDHGLATSFYTQKTKMAFFDRSWDAASGAPDTVGADNGRDKIDTYLKANLGAMVNAARQELTNDPAGLTFIHFGQTDFAGHDYGWGSTQYLTAVRQVDTYLGQLMNDIETDPQLANAVLIVTADHGGTGTVHTDASNPNNYTIPFAVWGAGVSSGVDLYALNLDRANPGTTQPPYSAANPPVRNADAANLVMSLLGLPVVPGSIINPGGTLDVNTGGGSDDPPVVGWSAPVGGSTVAGVVPVSATASDDGVVVSVEFRVDGGLIGTDTNGGDGWSTTWDTATVADGNHTLEATATDDAEQIDTDSVTVTVENNPSGSVEILMVVGDATTLTAGDTAVRNRLTAAGYEVTVIDDNAASVPDASQHDLVIVTASIASGTLDADIPDVTVPVLVAKPFVLDDFGLTAAPTSNYGTRTVSTISIVNPGHPTAAGLNGNIILRNPSTTVSWGIAPPDATVVATAGGDATIWNIAPGDPLADNTPAPACRLSFPIFGNMPTAYTTNAWALFDATITHATTNCNTGGGSDDPPVVGWSAPVGGSTVAGVVPVSATASDDGVVVSVEFRVDGGLIGTDTNGGDGWSTTWDTATVADGNHTLEATATDDAEQIDTDSVTVTVENNPSGSVEILMVVGDATTLTAGDTAVRNRLTAAGYEVTVIDDNAASVPDASQHDLVIVTASIASGTLDADIPDVTVPVLVAKPFVLDDFGLTAAPTSNYGTRTVSTISIVNPGHPTAAGLNGNIILRNPSTTVSWGIAPPDATVVATAGGDATIWNIAPGDPLADNTPAPACRLSFPIFGNMPTAYTTNAWALFDATITHATTNCNTGG